MQYIGIKWHIKKKHLALAISAHPLGYRLLAMYNHLKDITKPK